MDTKQAKKYFVYSLMLNGTSVYVGCTSNIGNRLRCHRANKEFDTHIIIERFNNKKDALACERSIIKFITLFPNGNLYNKEYSTLAILRDVYVQ